ncbi:MAG: hypothetical protein K2X27_01940 [Candidatus Obscuribacterales bacterium]|nr:hypothetical protein [Candidatus Obscuribacterales bacterium]
MDSGGIIIAILVLAAVIFGYINWRSRQKLKHSSAKLIRYASTAANEVLSSNWDHDEYYTRLYGHAAPELASHMYKNRSHLNKVLDERAELLGEFIDLESFELSPEPFSFIPTHVLEVKAVLRCSKARVPIIVLVNGAKEELTLDGIKVLKADAISVPEKKKGKKNKA